MKVEAVADSYCSLGRQRTEEKRREVIEEFPFIEFPTYTTYFAATKLPGKTSMASKDHEGDSDGYGAHFYPFVFTHKEFPADSNSSSDIGSPLGLMACPLVGRGDGLHLRPELTRNTEQASKMARCSHCTAYINPYCDITNVRWFCSLCGSRNTFTKHMPRYRAGDTRSLPEMQHTIVDFSMPLNGEYQSIQPSVSGSLKHDTDVYKVTARTSPLVHVFLIQESMSHDCLRAVIESASQTIREMHDDAHIALVSFSNRVCVYNCSMDSYDFDPKKQPTLLHADFHMENFSKGVKGDNGTGTNSTIVESGGAAWRDVELQQDQPSPLKASKTSGQAPKPSRDPNMKPKVTTPWHLGHISPFMNTIRRVGDARLSILEAFECVADYISEDIGSGDEATNTCTNLLGPALEATIKWILESPPKTLNLSRDLNESDDSTNSTSIFSTTGIMNFISDIGKALVGVVEDDEDHSDEDEAFEDNDGDVDLNKDVPDPQPTHSGGPAPIDVCSGVVLHVFASDPQDLPPNSHPSTNNSHGSIDASWLKSLSKKCASKGLAVNMWGVSSFDTDVIGLSSWYPLVRSTGGKVHRSVLGQIPKDERALLTEKMKRAIIPQIATKCLMKLRCSPQMNVGESSATGNMTTDEDLPGVYRTATCALDSSFAFTLEHRFITGGKSEKEKMSGVVVQMAFQYNTLVEATTSDALILEKEDKEFMEHIKERNEAMKGTTSEISNVIEGKSAMASRSFNQEAHFAEAVRGVLGLSDDWSKLKKHVAQRNKKNQTNEKTAPSNTSKSKKSSSRSSEDDDSDDLDNKGDWLNACRSCYDRGKRLMVVRRLRVITVNVDCAHKRQKCIRSIDTPVVVAILVRQMMEELADVLQGESLVVKVSTSDAYRALVQETRELMQEWAAAHVACSIRASAGSMDKNLIHESVENLMKTTKGEQLLRLLCSASNLGMAHRSLGWNPDRMAETASFISSHHAYKIATMLYPILLPVSSTGEVDTNKIVPLRRDSMLTHAPPDTDTFVLDSARELIIYKTLAAGASTKRGSAHHQNEDAPVSDTKQGSAQGQGVSALGGGILSFLGGQGTVAAAAAAKKASSAGILRKNGTDTENKQSDENVAVTDGQDRAIEAEKNKETEVRRSTNRTDTLLMERSDWLPNFVHGKLLGGTNAPRPVLSEAGTYSSVHFMMHLTEDGDGCGDENDTTIQSYNTFKAKVAELACAQLNSS